MPARLQYAYFLLPSAGVSACCVRWPLQAGRRADCGLRPACNRLRLESIQTSACLVTVGGRGIKFYSVKAAKQAAKQCLLAGASGRRPDLAFSPKNLLSPGRCHIGLYMIQVRTFGMIPKFKRFSAQQDTFVLDPGKETLNTKI